MIYEVWAAISKEELVAEYNKVEAAWPAVGYGTMIYNFRCSDDGLWRADFNRCNSCD
jgi:hypothetical protein